MFRNIEGNYEADLDSSIIQSDFEYKFILKSKDSNNAHYIWEEGQNRTCYISPLSEYNIIIINHFRINIKSEFPKFAGTAIPVFSFRSKNSFGIGDFGDLKLMMDFLSKTGQKVLQILPINDTTKSHSNEDSYPYGAISTYAIHPIYIDIKKLNSEYEKYLDDQTKYQRIELNKLSTIDYQKVFDLKWKILKILFERDSANIFDSEEYKVYFK
jgi:4-alpha-glucanotransferase